jgi:uncharacterized protein YgiM (DUF1202 family)
MKKVLLVLLAMGLVLCSVSTASGKDFVVEVQKNRVNLRAGGSMAHKIIAKLEPGSRIVALREVGDWYRVRIPKSVPVFISAKYVDMRDQTSGTVKGSRVNLRATAGTQYSIVGTANRGTALRILGRSGDWLKIEPPTCALGWVYKRYLKRLSGVAVKSRGVYASAPTVRAAASPVEDDLLTARAYRSGLEKWIAGDLSGAKVLFQGLMAKGSGKYSRLAGLQLRQISEIEAKQRKLQESQVAERTDRAVRDREWLEKSLEMIKTFINAKKEKKVRYVATGILQSMGLYIGRRGTHKLMKDGIETYHLRAGHKGAKLYDSRFYGRKVGLIGKVIIDPASHWKIIEVEKVVILD